MGTAIGLREDFDGAFLRRLSRTTKHANQARRLLALAEIYAGGRRSATGRLGGVGPQIVRDWVVRFNARGSEGFLDGKAPGPRSPLNDAQRQVLVDIVERGPIPAVHGVVRWRLIDLVQKLGSVKLTARPRHHTQSEHAMEAFKKGTTPPNWQKSEPPSRRARP